MYFIAIVLPGELNKKVLKWKNFMYEKFSCKVGLKSPAHITLIPPFWMPEEKENELIANINTISLSAQPFTIAVKNFSAFKPRTIYIDVVVNEKLRVLKAAIDEFFSERDYKIKTESRPFHPHITIATRDLHKKDFHESWTFFETKKFKAEWEATAFYVLRHNSKDWDVIHTSMFKMPQ
jgi:2'-5' RNA ligase